jgi:hypothetical protein
MLASELVAVGSDIHDIAARRRHLILSPRETPLIAIFSGFFEFPCLFKSPCAAGMPFQYSSCTILSPEILATVQFPATVLIPVFLWLTLLANTGIDLIEYGRKEKLAYERRELSILCPTLSATE